MTDKKPAAPSEYRSHERHATRAVDLLGLATTYPRSSTARAAIANEAAAEATLALYFLQVADPAPAPAPAPKAKRPAAPKAPARKAPTIQIGA